MKKPTRCRICKRRLPTKRGRGRPRVICRQAACHKTYSIAWHRAYRKTPKWRAYMQQPNVHAQNLAAARRWRQSRKGRETRRAYRKSLKWRTYMHAYYHRVIKPKRIAARKAR